MPSVADQAFGKIAPALRPVAEAAREAVLKAAPGAREEIKWGNLCFVGRRSFVAIIGQGPHVDLQFWDGTTVDPEGRLLEGTGKGLRHFKMRSVADARRADVMELVRKAAAIDSTKGGA